MRGKGDHLKVQLGYIGGYGWALPCTLHLTKSDLNFSNKQKLPLICVISMDLLLSAAVSYVVIFTILESSRKKKKKHAYLRHYAALCRCIAHHSITSDIYLKQQQ